MCCYLLFLIWFLNYFHIELYFFIFKSLGTYRFYLIRDLAVIFGIIINL